MASVEPYLTFGGNCEEAIAFYRKALGAEVQHMMRFDESPQKMPPEMMKPGMEKKIMHVSFRVGDSTLMASDGCGTESSGFKGFSLSFSVQTEAQADRAFAALSEGGKVTMPLAKTFWSPKFGMVTDKFGMSWMVCVAAPEYAKA